MLRKRKYFSSLCSKLAKLCGQSILSDLADRLVVESVGGVIVVMVSCAMPPHFLLSAMFEYSFFGKIRTSCLSLPPVFPGDLGNVGTSQDDSDELNDGQENTDAGVDNHHWDDVGFKLSLQNGDASIDKDPVEGIKIQLQPGKQRCTGYSQVFDFILGFAEHVGATALGKVVATGVWNGALAANGRVPIITVASAIVDATTTAEVTLQSVPLGGDAGVLSVLFQVLVESNGTHVVSHHRPQLQGSEDGDQLGNEGQGQKGRVSGDQDPVLRARDEKAVDTDQEGVNAQDDHKDGGNDEVS